MRKGKRQVPALLDVLERLSEQMPALLPGENNIPDGAATMQSCFIETHAKVRGSLLSSQSPQEEGGGLALPTNTIQ